MRSGAGDDAVESGRGQARRQEGDGSAGAEEDEVARGASRSHGGLVSGWNDAVMGVRPVHVEKDRPPDARLASPVRATRYASPSASPSSSSAFASTEALRARGVVVTGLRVVSLRTTGGSDSSGSGTIPQP